MNASPQHFATRARPAYATPLGVWLVVVAWGGAHLLLRALASPVLGTDDMFENVLVQTLQPGYVLRQPPLYEWLLWSVQQLTGPTIWSFLLLKYGLISLSALFLFLLARRTLGDARLAALCTFSYSLFFQFGWNLHEGVTHTVILVTACSATALTFVWALERDKRVAYAAFGLAVGAGLLAKHSFPLFLLGLLLAAISLAEFRRRLRPAYLLLSLTVAVVVYAPYLYWMVSGGQTLIASAADTMGVTGQQVSHLLRASKGLGFLGVSLVGFSVPLLPAVVLVFWRRYRQIFRPTEADGQVRAPLGGVARLLGRTVLVVIGLTAVLIVISGATYVKERHMHPLLLLLPIVLFADLQRFDWRGAFGPSCRRFAAVILAVVAIAFIARVPGLLAPDRISCGGKCRQMKPYADLQKPLAAMGAEDGILIGTDDYTAGNLRVLFPKAVVRDSEWAASLWAPVPKSGERTCLLVWEEGETSPETSAEERFSEVFGHLDVGAQGEGGPALYLTGAWPHLLKPRGWRTTWWGVKRLPPQAALCS
ncbi:ArnT family glycosyltransferase [Roseibium limicola]|uniref:Glycosyltransferase family 39 protein n=1 Tax=Roseibium limicola TaxID=2816037 RepID=A0A939EL56_9HYPH|nr:glycosyltransferase family 39 protein [Roseibium limicola]MBO0344710.1 glycosyltransferase family 39 protein [Roseibium limicola]